MDVFECSERESPKTNLNNPMNENLKIGIPFLLILSVLTAFVYNIYSPDGIPMLGQWNPDQGTVRAVPMVQDSKNSLEITDSEWVEQIILTQKRIVIDVRTNESYNQGHIPGAINFPLVDFEINFQQMMKTISRDQPLLIYCSGAECTDSHAFADILTNMQFKDIKIFTKGFRGWEKEGRRISVPKS